MKSRRSKEEFVSVQVDSIHFYINKTEVRTSHKNDIHLKIRI